MHEKNDMKSKFKFHEFILLQILLVIFWFKWYKGEDMYIQICLSKMFIKCLLFKRQILGTK